MAIDEQVRAYGGPQYQVLQQVMNRFSEAIERSQIDIVPKIVMNGGSGAGGNGTILESLMALILSEKMGVSIQNDSESSDPIAKSYRDDLKSKLSTAPTNVQPLKGA